MLGRSAEFRSITLSQWKAEYEKLPPTILGKSPLSYNEVYQRLNIVDDILSEPSEWNYQEKRAALVIETLSYFPLEVRRGGIALAVWMAKEYHAPTHVMGIELCGSIIALRDWLKIPTRTDRYIRSVLVEYKAAYKTEGAAFLIRQWQGEAPEMPLNDWLKQMVQPTSA